MRKSQEGIKEVSKEQRKRNGGLKVRLQKKRRHVTGTALSQIGVDLQVSHREVMQRILSR